jgi:thioredoxin-like negative regulator of GroEL
MKEFTSAREFMKFWTSDPAKQGPVFIWFSASWCGPCQTLLAHQKELEAAAGSRSLYYCNISKAGDESAGYCGVSKLPTFALVVPGRVLAHVEGADMDRICKFMRAHQG